MNKTAISTFSDFTIDEDIKIAHLRGDFADGPNSMARSWFHGKKFSAVSKKDLEEIDETVNYLCEETASSYGKLSQICSKYDTEKRGFTDLYTCSEHFNYWVRLLPSMDSYNVYIKVYVRTEEIFYFTFGTSETHPFQRGWTTVYAKDQKDATATFRHYYPVTEHGLLNCCSYYPLSNFYLSNMPQIGNLGKYCHIKLFSKNITISKSVYYDLDLKQQRDFTLCRNCNEYYLVNATQMFQDLETKEYYVGCKSCISGIYEQLPQMIKNPDFLSDDKSVQSGMSLLDMKPEKYDGYLDFYHRFVDRYLKDNEFAKKADESSENLRYSYELLYSVSMGMDLLTPWIKKELPDIQNKALSLMSEEKWMVYASFGHGHLTWYVLRGQERTDGDWLLFCYIHSQKNPSDCRFDYVSLGNLLKIRHHEGVERDFDFRPTQLGKLKKYKACNRK